MTDVTSTQQASLAGLDFVVPAGPAGQAAVEAAVPIVLHDEYVLKPISRAGHWPQYVVDVGANCGVFTLRAAQFWPDARFLAFEPDPENADCLDVNLCHRLVDARVYRAAAVGVNQPDSLVLRRYPQRTTGNHLLAEDAVGQPGFGPEANPSRPHQDITVPTVRVSQTLNEAEWPRVDLLKLDCEGAELAVLEDLSTTGWLDKTRWIRLEWHDRRRLDPLQALLTGTHHVHLDRRPKHNGPGLAHPRWDRGQILAPCLSESLIDKHAGQVALILGDGPSLDDYDLEDPFFREVVTIGCNRIGLRYQPDYYLIVDPACWKRDRNLVRPPSRLLWGWEIQELPPPGAFVVRHHTSEADLVAPPVKGHLYHGRKSGTLMLHVAYQMGFRRFFMLGIDGYQPGRWHFYEPADTTNPDFANRDRVVGPLLEAFAGQIAREGGWIWNLSARSRYAAVPKCTLDQAKQLLTGDEP